MDPQEWPVGQRVRVAPKIRKDKFAEGMEGAIVENRVESKICLVHFDGESEPCCVGYRYLLDPSAPGGGAPPASPRAPAPPSTPAPSAPRPNPRLQKKDEDIDEVSTAASSPVHTARTFTSEPENAAPQEKTELVEVARLRKQLQERDEEIKKLQEQNAKHAEEAKKAKKPANPEETGSANAAEELKTAKEEVTRLNKEVHDKKYQILRLEAEMEKELEDGTRFIGRLALSSSEPVLEKRFDMSALQILGRGNYGYVLTCKDRQTNETVVMKLQSDRWAGVCVKEWAHGSEVGEHAHIVQYCEAFMHRDSNKAIQQQLQNAFDCGTLTGKRPKQFPWVYFGIAIEFMDRGTVQSLMDNRVFTLESIGAVTRQMASALAFMHSKKRTHNDLKPENVLLKSRPDSDTLIAKLADFGLANHSSDTTKDMELFGTTLWCMGLNRPFGKPAGDRQVALNEFKQKAGANAKKTSQNEKIVEELGTITDLTWQGRLSMREVLQTKCLQSLEVTVPSSATKKLEACARRSVLGHSGMTQEFIRQSVQMSPEALAELQATQAEMAEGEEDNEEDGEAEDE